MSESKQAPSFAVKILVALTLAVSIAASVAAHLELPVADLFALVPRQVWRGEVFRLFSWVFLSGDPIGLGFACAMLWRFGGDLATPWGTKRLVLVYFGLAAITGALTCLVALTWPRLMATPLLGAWPISEAIFIAWALMFPERELYLYFVVRVSGWTAVLATFSTTVLFAFYFGPALFVSHFAAQALALLFMADLPRAMDRTRRRIRRIYLGRRYLHVVERDDPPPTTPIWIN